MAGNTEPQHNGDEVDENGLRCLAQGIQNTAFPKQIPEHEEAHQRGAGRGRDSCCHGNENREEDLCGFFYIPFSVGHPNQPFLSRGHQADYRRLNNGNQRHIAVSGHHNGPQVFGAQGIGYKNGGGAVRRANDGNGCRVPEVKKETGQNQGQKNAQLGSGAEEHQPGLFQQGAEVDHGADADKEQQREKLVCHSGLKEDFQGGGGAGQRQIHKNGAEAHGQKQTGFHFFADGKIDEPAAHQPHQHHLPGNGFQVE